MIRIDPSGNIYGESLDYAPTMPTTTGVYYNETDTGYRKVGITGKTFSELTYLSYTIIGGLKRTIISNSSTTLTTLFQSVLTFVPSNHVTIQGWIDISNMIDGDSVMVEVSMNNKVHSMLQYTNAQVMPILHVDGIIVGSGDTYTVRVKQTLGTPISVAYKFFTEE